MIDDTVRIEIEGPAIATNLRPGVEVPADPAAPEDSDEVRQARRRDALARIELERIEAAIARLSASSIIAEDPTDDPPAAWDAIVAARRTLVATRVARELALATELSSVRGEVAESERALAAALDRDRRRSSARPAKAHELRKHVDVELEPTDGENGDVTIRLEYLVAAARWAPTYVARLGQDASASVEIRAVVAQATGEDWDGVPISLSTAEPTRFAPLPELATQRIGRRQAEPARTGFRAPPAGAEALFADYDRDAPKQRLLAEPEEPAPMTTTALGGLVDQPDAFGDDEEVAFHASAYDTSSLAEEDWDEGSSAAKEAFATPPRGIPVPQQQAMPAAAPVANIVRTRGDGGGARRASAKKQATPKKPRPPAPPVNLLDYGNLVMAPPSSPQRGRLVAAPARPHDTDAVEGGRARIAALTLPPGCAADWSHAYDYAFASDGAVEVMADGSWHSIAVTARPTTAKIHHVAVPREQADVFRIAEIDNPFVGPLLPGPIDVYDRGRFLVTSRVDYTPPGASVEVGLGVDATVKIARNTEYREEAAGMLRGVLLLHHAISIDVDNVSGRAVDLEVRERIPVTREDDDDIEVKIERADPAWQRWTPEAKSPRARKLRGGYRWIVTLPPGQKRTLRVAYEVKIPGKSELVGGNRRET